MTQCGFCKNTNFEIAEHSPKSANYKSMFVQCTSCNAPAGVLEYYNNGAKIETLDKKVTALGKHLSAQVAELDRLLRNLAR